MLPFRRPAHQSGFQRHPVATRLFQLAMPSLARSTQHSASNFAGPTVLPSSRPSSPIQRRFDAFPSHFSPRRPKDSSTRKNHPTPSSPSSSTHPAQHQTTSAQPTSPNSRKISFWRRIAVRISRSTMRWRLKRSLDSRIMELCDRRVVRGIPRRSGTVSSKQQLRLTRRVSTTINSRRGLGFHRA